MKSRRIRGVGNIARIGESRVVYRVLVGKPKGNRPLGRTRGTGKDGSLGIGM